MIGEIWKKLYDNLESIMDLEPWQWVSDMDALVIERPGKPDVYISIMGMCSDLCGIAIYFTAEDYTCAQMGEVNEALFDNTIRHWQNAIIAVYYEENALSTYNRNILTELERYPDENGYCLYFEKYEFGYVPGKVKIADAEEVNDILQHLKTLLCSVKDPKPYEIPWNQALVRRYDPSTRQWHNGIENHEIVDMTYSLPFPVTETMQDLSSTPGQGTWHVRCTPQSDRQQENGRDYFPIQIQVSGVPKSMKNLPLERSFSPAEVLAGEVAQFLWELVQVKKPEVLFMDTPILTIFLEDFCKKTGIFEDMTISEDLDVEAMLNDYQPTMNDPEDLYAYLAQKVQEMSMVRTGLKQDPIVGDASYVVSVSLKTGLYRHICIDAHATLAELHYAILDAFEFIEDGHLYRFSKKSGYLHEDYYSRGMKSFLEDMEETGKYADDYTIGAVFAVEDKFQYLFDFGDAWTFTCKILRMIEKPTAKPVVIRKVGEAPEQYAACEDGE